MIDRSTYRLDLVLSIQRYLSDPLRGNVLMFLSFSMMKQEHVEPLVVEPTGDGDLIDSTAAAAVPSDACNAMQFAELCSMFEKLYSLSGHERKLDCLFTKKLKRDLNGASIYPLLRLVIPTIDSERSKYGLKHASVASTYIAALNLDKASLPAQRLKSWKDPTKIGGYRDRASTVQASGDFGDVLESILKVRVQSRSSTATLGEVNLLLDALATADGSSKKTDIIRNRILPKFNAMEQKWLVRIIFNDLKVGISYTQILDRFYPRALERYNECLSLKLVCEEEGICSELSGLQLFTGYSPMLAKGFPRSPHGQFQQVEKEMEGNPFLMEVKLDGERMSIHVDTSLGKVKMFTRNGNDYTDIYRSLGESVLTSVLTSAAGAAGGMRCILDGEVCVWDGLNNCHAPFGSNRHIAKQEHQRDSDNEECDAAGSMAKDFDSCVDFGLIYTAFDVTFVEGPSSQALIQSALRECGVMHKVVPSGEVTNLPLLVRKRILSSLVSPIANRVDLISYKAVTEADVKLRAELLEAYYNDVVTAGEEGLIVKNLNSSYKLGKSSRSTGYWVKMKPEYGDETRDLDFLILGAYYGEGTSVRGKGLSVFLCGVKDDRDPGLYHTVCKVGTGYSFQQLSSIRQQISAVSVPWDVSRPPKHFSPWRPRAQDRPDVYIPPDKSIVVEVKCAELTTTDMYSAGLTCRFPRIHKIRMDKSFEEVLSLSELCQLKQSLRFSTEEVTEKRKRSTTAKTTAPSRRRRITADQQYQVPSDIISSGNRVDDIFRGRVFCVLGNEFDHLDRTFSRDDLVFAIQSNSGEVVAAPSKPNCQIVVGNKRTLQINNYIQNGEKDVINFTYIVDCINAKALLPLRRHYYLGLSEAAKEHFNGSVDAFGDSLVEDAVPGIELQVMFQSIGGVVDICRKKCQQIAAASLSTKKKATAADASPVVTAMRKKLEDCEARSIVSDWDSMRSLPWRDLVAQFLDEDERRILCDDSRNYFWSSSSNLVFYFDIFLDFGATSCDKGECCRGGPLELSGGSSAAVCCVRDGPPLLDMKTLYYQFLLHGAAVCTHLHCDVTHVITDMRDEARRGLIEDRLRVLRTAPRPGYEKRVVSVGWARDCLSRCEVIPM